MYSSCGLCMVVADGVLEGPDFGGREHAGKRRVLAQTAAFLAVRLENLADVFERAFKKGLPFVVAADESGSVRVQTQPTGEIVMGDLHERRLLPEPGCDAPSHLQADLVEYLVLPGWKNSRLAWLRSTAQ